EIFFTVSDEGTGIPEDERAKIFDMFYTAARGDRGGQGTGLGLAICQVMVGAPGGRISVAEGIDGRGTSITLHLPLQTQPGLDNEA
ncbi:sensor histidine kinase, partial [Pseudomonas fluorescens]|uniref:sensor histidine kinase n=1 Tax=Pseudomonas fluorescens TaxID=294 RepID=UPI002182297C